MQLLLAHTPQHPQLKRLACGMVLIAEVILVQGMAQALPPPEDIPEEVLQMDVLVEARSPIDGQPLSAADYAELQDQLRQTPEEVPARLAPQLPRTVGLLRLRKVLKLFLPFIP